MTGPALRHEVFAPAYRRAVSEAVRVARMVAEPHKPEHWNPGVRFGLGLTIMTACLSGLIPDIPRLAWLAGVFLGLLIMGHSVVPFYKEQRKKFADQGKRMIAIYVMVICGFGFVGSAATVFFGKPAVAPLKAGSEHKDKHVLTGDEITLHSLFIDDLNGRSYNLIQGMNRDLFLASGIRTNFSFEVGLYGDFLSNSLFMGIYIPATEHVQELLASFAEGYKDYLYDAKTNLHMWIAGAGGDNSQPNSGDLRFTGQIYIYTENVLSDDDRFLIETRLRAAGLQPIFRGFKYLEFRREHGPGVIKRETPPVSDKGGLIPPIFTPDPNNEADPTLLTLFMNDVKGDGKGLRVTAASDVTLEVGEKKTKMTTKVVYNCYFNRTAGTRQTTIYMPAFLFSEAVLTFSATQVQGWQSKVEETLLSEHQDAAWIRALRPIADTFIYSQVSLTDTAVNNVAAAFRKIGLRAIVRGDTYWHEKLWRFETRSCLCRPNTFWQMAFPSGCDLQYNPMITRHLDPLLHPQLPAGAVIREAPSSCSRTS